MILDGFEMQVYMVHGKWFEQGWYTGLMDPMWGYFKHNNFGERQKKEAFDARDLILNEFLRFAYSGFLNLRDFCHVEWLENKMLTPK